MRSSLFLGLALGRWAVEALDPNCAPGGNFDMRYWNLQLPIGSPGSPTTISSSSLQGCGGYQNWNYFFSQKADGALVMKVPGSPESAGCVTTPNSKHCRSELRELDPNNGRAASWDPYQPVNRLFARLSCGLTGDGTGTVIGQIKIDDAISTKPVAELYYGQDGSLTMGVGQTRAGGNQVRFPAGNIPLGQVFTYEIRYENNELSVIINGGAKQVFTTFQLNAPRSYFKVGNYLQGSTPSSVHFFEIRVQHDTKPITPAWPPQGSTGPREGLGPFNIMVQAGHTLTSVPPTNPTSGSSCDLSVPDIASDNTVTLRLFSGSDCCSAVQTIKLGTLDSCHNANADFGSLVEAVGENMFDRGIKVMTYEGRDCTGTSQPYKLTNNEQCFFNTDTPSKRYKSFQITAAGSPTCSPAQPTGVSDNNVALNLFSDSGCCTRFQSIKMGTLNSCHDANNVPAGFKSFTQAAGQNMFGRNIRLVTYSGAGCTGTATITSLTNTAKCNINTNSVNRPFLSFKISNTTEGSNSGGGSTGGSGGECTTPAQPTNDSDNTVAVSLFGDTGCCSAPVETSKIGKFGVCHNANKPFKGTTQTVGQNLFGRNIKIRQYTSRDCSDSAWAEINLSNKALCYVGSGQYQSYMIAEGASSGGGGGGTSSGGGSTGSGAGSCNSAQPNKKSDTTVVLSLFKESSCCTAVETSAIGKLDVCHKANAPFQAIKQAVGQDMFGRGISIQMFTSDDCSDKAWAQSSLSNKDVCTYGTDKYRSFRIASGSSGGTTPTNPNPPSSCESVTPKPASEDLLQLELYSDDGCCKRSNSWGVHVPSSGNFGCLTAPSRFKSLSQGVGQNLFGRDIMLYMYEDNNCANGQYWVLSLSNAKVCNVGAPSNGWGSFKIAVKGTQNSGGGGGGGSSGGGGGTGQNGTPSITCHMSCVPLPPVQNCICICSDGTPRNPMDGWC